MLSTLQLSGNIGEGDTHLDGDRNTKKVRFKETIADEDTSMAEDPKPQQTAVASVGNDSDFELLEGGVNTSIIDGIPTIEFLDRVKEILFKEMEMTDPDDYNRALTQGPWTIYGQYLTVQPWSKHFNPLQPYPSIVLTWIQLPNLPGHLYKRNIIEAIGGLIGKVVKLDFQTDNQTRGRFARLAIYINLDRPLISKYGHVKEMCTLDVANPKIVVLANTVDNSHGELTVVVGYLSVGCLNGEKMASDSKERAQIYAVDVGGKEDFTAREA
ncbi:hypothetical protein CXB51_029888 [Gossypium anomalum]|uniref:DUF4283 domain-containing protein n=1 Tax=Gossypium anomalum TaxID=47600 RepID=A0A8J6CLG6_9ROSI|nr:hypothetical protein CXB51_029888 [Gossypium anomalum]